MSSSAAGGSAGGGGSDEPNNETKKVETGYEAVKKRFDGEFQDLRDYDSKAGSIVGYVTLMTGLLVGLGTFALLDKLTKPEYYIPFFAAIILFLATVMFSLVSIRLVRFRDVPGIDFVKNSINDPDLTYADFSKDLIIAMGGAIEHNHARNKHKSKLVRASWWCLILGFIALIIYAGIYIGTNIPKQNQGLGPDSNNTLAATFVYDILSETDNSTLESLFPGLGEDDTAEFKSVASVPILRPDTNDPWIELRNQWTHDGLNIYVMTDSNKVDAAAQAIEVIKSWSELLKTNSRNSTAWNFNILNIQNLSQRNIPLVEPADIVVILRDEPKRSNCQDSWGYTEREDENKQYALVYTSCSSTEASKEQITTTLYHELAHTLGLGHAFNKNMDLMCGKDQTLHNQRTCLGIMSKKNEPSKFDIDALLYTYGTDGFGGMNRELGNKPYYFPQADETAMGVEGGNRTADNATAMGVEGGNRTAEIP